MAQDALITLPATTQAAGIVLPAPGGGGAGAVAAYFEPLLSESVSSADINSLVSSLTQDPTTLEWTAVINNGATAGTSNPTGWRYDIIPLADAFGEIIGVNELHSFTPYLEITSGMLSLDTAAIYVGIVNGALIGEDTVWMRFDTQNAGDRKMRSGSNGTRAAASPAGDGGVNGRMGLLMRWASVGGVLRIVETNCDAANAANEHITNSNSGLAGLTVDVDNAPHVLICAGAFGALAELTVKFKVKIAAYKHPGGVLP